VSKAETLWLWCNDCKKGVKAFFIEVTLEKWIMVNPHEHALSVGICPRTVWIAKDFKEFRHPRLAEVFKACEEGRVKEALKILEEVEEP
jgi:hypothetical protein